MSAKCQKRTLANLPEHVRHEIQETLAAVPFSDVRGILSGPVDGLAIIVTSDGGHTKSG